MSSNGRLRLLPGGGTTPFGALLTLADFPLGTLGGSALPVYRTKSGRLHFDRHCSTLSNSRNLDEESLILPVGGSLADIPVQVVHCGPWGELGAYWRQADRLCAVAQQLPGIAERLEVRLSSLRDNAIQYEGFGSDVDWQVICEARTAWDELAEARQPPQHSTTSLRADHLDLIRESTGEVAVLAGALYQRALRQARSERGRLALGRMLAAINVLSGRIPRRYAPIYQEFRGTIKAVLKAMEGFDRQLTESLVGFLEDRNHFDLAQQWLETMVKSGDPDRVATTLNEGMEGWEALKKPSLRQTRKRVLEMVSTSATAYLDGLRIRGEEPVLALMADYASPFSYTAIDKVQWDIFPSATCRLRGEQRDDTGVEARVAVVPRLWVDALSDADSIHRGGQFMVLAHELDPLQRTPEVCAAVAKAITRACDASLLSCRQWNPGTRTRRRLDRVARDAVAPILSQR